MSNYNFNDKTFVLVTNSASGKVSTETIFKYQQVGNLVTADYAGGTINYGKILAILQGDVLEMLYHCLTTDDQLKAGKAIAKITLDDGRMKLSLNWEWLVSGSDKGRSEYLEVN